MRGSDGRGGGRGGGHSGGSRGGGRSGGRRPQPHDALTASSVPVAVLSLHQPLASMVAHGLQRLDGRVWRSDYRGPLWIHAAAKDPTDEAIADMEAFHAAVYRSLAGDANEHAQPTLPPSYPTSCLLGCVDMVGCVSAAEYATWLHLPNGAREEASIHGTDHYFLFESHRRLVLPLKMSGQHKLWPLEHQLAKSLWEGTGSLMPSAQAPVRWMAQQQDVAANTGNSDGTRPSEPTDAMRRNARRTAARQAKQAATSAAASTAGEGAGAESAPAATAPSALAWSQCAGGGGGGGVGGVGVAHGGATPRGQADSAAGGAPASSGGHTVPHAAGAAPAEDAMDAWMLAEALAISATHADASAAATQQAVEMLAALEAGARDDGTESKAGADESDDDGIVVHMGAHEPGDVIEIDDDWARRVADLTRMGFERAHAVEMLTLCNGDVEQAVQLLCTL